MSTQMSTQRTTTITRVVRMAQSSEDLSSSHDSINKFVGAQVRIKRDHEKKELVHLNERLAVYLERVKFLEKQNTKLLAELEELRRSIGMSKFSYKEQLEPGLLDARSKIDYITREKAIAEIRAKRSEYDTINFKRQFDEMANLAKSDKVKIASLEQILQDNRAELEYLSRQMGVVEADVEKYKAQAITLNEDLLRLLSSLDEATLMRVKLQNEKQTLEEQIPFLNAIHEQEIAELKVLQSGGYVDPTQFYRHELEKAIRDIRGDFEQLNEAQRRELEEWYRLKVEEHQQRVEKRAASVEVTQVEDVSGLASIMGDGRQEMEYLKSQNVDLLRRYQQLEEELETLRRTNSQDLAQKERELAELKASLQDCMNNYDALMNNTISLEFEINTYRRLLDLEGARATVTAERTKVVTAKTVEVTKVKTAEETTSSSSVLSAKTTFQKSAKGPATISECSLDGRYILLENISKNVDVDLTNWTLKRRVDSQPDIVYKFPAVTLKANQTLRIWTKEHREPSPNDLINKDIESWGMGVKILTVVYDSNGDEKTTHLQQTIFGI